MVAKTSSQCVLGFASFGIVQLLRKLYWLFTDNWNWSEIDIGTSSLIFCA